MWIHLHIPKNAGTTFSAILDRSFTANHVRVYDRYNPSQKGKYRGHFDEAELIELIESVNSNQAVLSGHHILMPSDAVIERFDLHFVTWIRHPVDRVLSLYRYERKFSRLMPDVYGKRHLSQLPFDDYVKERLQLDDHLSDWQCHELSATKSFEQARKVLDKCSAVGIVDQFDDSLLIINRAMGRSLKTPYEQKNMASRPSVANELTPSTRDVLESVNREDLRLYEYAKDRLDASIHSIGMQHTLRRTMLKVSCAKFRLQSKLKRSLLRPFYRRLRGS